MPYISPERRNKYEPLVRELERLLYIDIGDVNYIMTKLLQQYEYEHGAKYATYNALVGALECCKLELYRRQISSYEDKKIAGNGDVY